MRYVGKTNSDTLESPLAVNEPLAIASAASLLVRCLENEGVEYIFGIPGHENVAVMESLSDSHIVFVCAHNEQGAAFMAEVYGRLTAKPGVCLATLGLSPTNLVTAIADANMDLAPVVVIAGRGAASPLSLGSRQILDLVSMFALISKSSTRISTPKDIPWVVRSAFDTAQSEKPGASFIEFSENVAEMASTVHAPRIPRSQMQAAPHQSNVLEAAQLIDEAQCPVIIAGNGVIRAGASGTLTAFSEELNIPVATTSLAKGAIPDMHPLCLGTVGLQVKDYVNCGLDRSDLLICVGYDMSEYPPYLWSQRGRIRIIHIDVSPAESDRRFRVSAAVLGDINAALTEIAVASSVCHEKIIERVGRTLEAVNATSLAAEFPLHPGRIVMDLRRAMGPADLLICDGGAHKTWVARLFEAEYPNTCIVSNGFSSRGVGISGAVAAKIVNPERKVVAVTGEVGFVINSQEIKTAMRMGLAIVVLVWNSCEYGPTDWHKLRQVGREGSVNLCNADLVSYAESFGAKGYRVTNAEGLLPALLRGLEDDTVVIIDCPVHYDRRLNPENYLQQQSPVG